MVITWTNEWMEAHWWEIPTYILKVIDNKMSDNKEFIYDLIKNDNFQELYNLRDFIISWINYK